MGNRARWRRVAALGIAVLLLSLPLLGQAAVDQKPGKTAARSWSLRWTPARLVNGAPVLFRMKPPAKLKSLTGAWLGHEVFFNFDPRTRTWYGIAGISLETAPGKHPLALQAVTAGGGQTSFERAVVVGHKRYPTTTLTVAQQYTEPSPELPERIKQEKELKAKLFGSVEAEREWAGSFAPPVRATVSGVFGTRRVINGAVQSVHQGLDYRVLTGTPVSALNRGTVLLARPLFFEGNCVVLDHGQGLLTLYLHLSEIKVKEGDRVARGQRIGRSGGTGRATGPHLHLAVRWQGVYLNPATLLQLRLP